MAWWDTVANSKEPFLKIIEGGINYLTKPAWDGAKGTYNYLATNYPNISLLIAGVLGVLGYVRYNRFRTKKHKERVSEKEKHLDLIPGIHTMLSNHKRDLGNVESAMLAVSTATLANTSENLSLVNKLREIYESLVAISKTGDSNGRKLDALKATTDEMNKAMPLITAYGSKLKIIEDRQNDVYQTVSAIDSVVRPRSATK